MPFDRFVAWQLAGDELAPKDPLALMATGLDQTTSFSAVAACLNNLGPGLGDVSGNYANISPVAKYLLCLAMVLGRLEIFTLLVLFTPSFWRR